MACPIRFAAPGGVASVHERGDLALDDIAGRTVGKCLGLGSRFTTPPSAKPAGTPPLEVGELVAAGSLIELPIEFRNMRNQLLLIIFLFTVSVSAQSRTFKWSDELCEYEGKYNSKKYNEVVLRNTLKLLSHDGFRLNSTDATVWTFDEIAKLDPSKVENRYRDIIDELEHLEYISTPYTDEIKRQKLVEARQLYQLVRTTMAAYTKPEVIRNYKGAEACKLNFGEPIIAGGDKLAAAWRKVNLRSQSNNADPARLQRRFEEQNASPDRLKFALVETMSFGWWNCANAEVKRSDVSMSDRPIKEFKKLFVRVKTISCDEP
jgi:hypothetical protein